jgi:hypothetical protein
MIVLPLMEATAAQAKQKSTRLQMNGNMLQRAHAKKRAVKPSLLPASNHPAGPVMSNSQ